MTKEELQKQKEERLGAEVLNTQGCLMKIIEYNKATDVLIEFQDHFRYKIRTCYTSFKKRTIKNLYYPTVLGVGITGSKYPCRINGKISTEYGCWYSMINRCYDEKMLKKEPTYIPCYVCEEWLLYENFYEWLHSQENFKTLKDINDLQLDKDILYKGNKIYSPDTCCLVPREINMLLVKSNAIRGNLPIGVRLSQDGKYDAYYSYKNKYNHIGHYSTSDEAFYAYKKNKECLIKIVAKKEYNKDNITKKCYDALINYEVEITD